MTLKKVVRWLIPALWLAFVIFLSCQTGNESEKLSRWLAELLFVGPLPKYAHSILRIFAHFGVHLVLGLLIYMAARNDVRQPAGFTLIVGFVIGIYDELLQLFVSGRAFEISDLAFNIFGIIVAVAIVSFIPTRSSKNRPG